MMFSRDGTADRFRALLAGPEVIELPGCYDVLSALLLEEAGFSAVFLSGYGVASSLFGNPDIGLTSVNETALVARNVTNAVRVPVVVDADNGYGPQDSVIRTIYELECAGAAALTLEDQVFPKRCGHVSEKRVVPLAEYLRKLESALRARQTPLCIIARTDASPIDEAIARAKAFHAAGADVTLVDGLESVDALKRVADEVPGPKQINLIYGGRTPLLSVAELGTLGFKIVLYSTPALYVAYRAVREQMKRLHEAHDIRAISDASAAFREFQAFVETRYAERQGVRPVTAESRGTVAATTP